LSPDAVVGSTSRVEDGAEDHRIAFGRDHLGQRREDDEVQPVLVEKRGAELEEERERTLIRAVPGLRSSC